ncbi:MAG: YqaJ viral recombinase family protein, partial [Colwellia sp.]|nr:YqaJ viral recombinase family protein [Colwellia sp.]
MQRGTELEPEARNYYQFITDVPVKEVGLIYKNKDKLISCSPDGISKDRGLEIKCPAPHTHIEYLLNDKLPTKYIPQVQGSMWVTGLKKWDFLSYHPDLPPLLLTVDADEIFHNTLDELMEKFVECLLIKRNAIKELIK